MISSITCWASEGLAALNNGEHRRRQGTPIGRRTRLIGTVAITVLAMAVPVLGGTAAVKYSGGAGEPNDPYRIAVPQDLDDIEHQ